MLSRQRYLAYVAQQPSAAPAPRQLTRGQRLLAIVLWACLIPFLLIGFLMVGERPRLKS